MFYLNTQFFSGLENNWLYW